MITKAKFVSLIFLLSLIIIFGEFTISEAADLGVWGETSQIIEEDFEEHIIKKLQELGADKLRSHQEFIKDKIVANVKRPKSVPNITNATKNTSRLYDPSFTLTEDIFGDKNQLLISAGTRINPIEKRSFDEIWIFIDGNDDLQVEFAKNYSFQKNINNKKIILLSGAPGSQKDGTFFYFDQLGEISKKLNITKVPTIVRQSPDVLQILIEEIDLEGVKRSDS